MVASFSATVIIHRCHANESSDLLAVHFAQFRQLCQERRGDFKLLGAIGDLISWAPVAKSNLFKGADSPFILFVGFTGILFIITVIATRDLIKQAVIEHYVRELLTYEAAIRTQIGDTTQQSFRWAEHWLTRGKGVLATIYLSFTLLFILILFFLPVVVLAVEQAWGHAGAYVLILIIALMIYFRAARSIQVR